VPGICDPEDGGLIGPSGVAPVSVNRRVKYEAPLLTDGLTPVDVLLVEPVPLPVVVTVVVFVEVVVVAVELPPKLIMTSDESPRLQPDESRSKAAQLVSYVLRD